MDKQKPDFLLNLIAPQNATDAIRYEKMFENGICQIDKEHFSKMLRFSDINYQTARVSDQKDTFMHYCEVLNSLDPTITLQLCLLTRQVDEKSFEKDMFIPLVGDSLDEYRTEINQMEKEKLKEGQNSTVREKYFVYTAKAEDYETAQSALARFETQFIALFRNMDVEDVHVLSGQERINTMRTITRSDERKTLTMRDIAFSGYTSRSFVAPPSFDFSDKTGFEFGNKYGQVLWFGDLPPDLNDQLLSDFTDLPINMVISIHMKNVNHAQALSMVNTQIAFMEMDNNRRARKAWQQGTDPRASYLPETVQSLKNATALHTDLVENDQRLFEVTPLIYVYADTEEELIDYIYRIKSTAQKRLVTAQNIDYQQIEAFNSVLPIGKNFHGKNLIRNLTTASTAIMIPFTTQELYQKGGVYFGQNAISRNIIMFNRKQLHAPNGFILGKPGSGKSFAAKREMILTLINDPNADVICIDPEREYTQLAYNFDGEVVRIAPNSNVHINPLDINESYADDGDPLTLKSDFFISMIDLIQKGSISNKERSILDRTLRLCYEKYFKTQKVEDMPTMQDFYALLVKQDSEEARELALSLEYYIKGSANLFAHKTNVDLSKRFVIFDIHELGKSNRTLGMLIVLDQIWNRITKNRASGRETYLFIDEIQLLFTNSYSSDYFFELWTRSRKYGAIPTGITQNVETLLQSDNARRMLSNSDFIMAMNQAHSDRQELAELLSISDRQLRYITNTEPGSGLLFAGKSIIPFNDKFPMDTKIYKMITTKLSEVIAQQKEKEETA